ncbi:MAG: hypothetical protein AB7O54_00785 [Pseudomonadales bacterium]
MSFVYSGSGGNCSACVWVAAEGEITEQTPDLFRHYVETGGFYGTVALHSPGGNLKAGLELGLLFRELGVTTIVAKTEKDKEPPYLAGQMVAGVCASACAYAFMGGVQRHVGGDDWWSVPEGRVGIHQFSMESTVLAPLESTQSQVGLLLAYTLSMGINSEVLVAASVTPPTDMHWVSRQDAIDVRLDNSTHYFSGWTPKTYGRGLMLRGFWNRGGSEKAEVQLSCRDASTLRIRISDRFHRFEAPTLGTSSMTIDGREHEIPRDSIVEYQLTGGDELSIAFDFQIQRQKLAGQEFEFDPDFSRADGPILEVTARFPTEDWFDLLLTNCPIE